MSSRPAVAVLAAAALVAAGVHAGAARGQAAGYDVTDWVSLANPHAGDDVAVGTLLGRSITLAGSYLSDGSTLDPTWTFPAPAFTPALAHSDMIEIRSSDPAYSYTITFGAPVADPILELSSIGSTLQFAAGTQIVKLSGDPGVSVSGSTVTGIPLSKNGSTDPDASVQLIGTFTTVPFTSSYTLSGFDGVPMQVVAPLPAPTPTPTATAAPTATATPVTRPALPAAAPPVAGVRLASTLATGAVSVKLPGGQEFVPLEGVASLPVGSVVDARAGSVDLVAAADAAGHQQAATVSAGIFQIRQAHALGAESVTTTLVAVTPPGLARACAAKSFPSKGVVRTLSITAKGLFATAPAKGVVSGRNASWTTLDRCDGTLVKVKRGHVKVRKSAHRTVTIAGGHSLLLKALLFAARQRG